MVCAGAVEGVGGESGTQGLKPAYYVWALDAALKRRSSTVDRESVLRLARAGAKARLLIWALDAALKRRSSTVGPAFGLTRGFVSMRDFRVDPQARFFECLQVDPRC